MGDLRDCGGCVAYEEMLDLVAQALGKELFAAHDGFHYEAVRSLVYAHGLMSEDTARMRAVIAEKQAEIDAWKEASQLEIAGDPGRCKHCGNDACTFHHPICAEALYEHEHARRHGMPPSGRHG